MRNWKGFLGHQNAMMARGWNLLRCGARNERNANWWKGRAAAALFARRMRAVSLLNLCPNSSNYDFSVNIALRYNIANILGLDVPTALEG